MTESYRVIALDEIRESATNPRRTFNEEKLAELAESIREKGVIEPLVVRPVNGHFELVAGARRFRAAGIVGRADVPCMVREYSDADVLEIQIIENLQRENPNIFEEAEGYRTLREQLGYDVATIAGKIGKSKRYVYQRLEVAGVAASVRSAVGEKVITPNHAMLIARLPRVEQQQEALEYAVRREASVRDLDRWIKQSLLLKLTAAPFDLDDAELFAPAGSCAACPKRSGNSEVFAEISSPDVCTDRACYELKVDQHINREIARADGGLVQVTDSWYWPEKPKHVYDPKSYTEVTGKRCAHTSQGIVVYGERRGSKLDVCFTPTCKVHGRGIGSGSARRSQEDVERDRQAKLELDMARAVRGRIVDAVVGRAPEFVTHRLLEDWAEAWWERLGSDLQRIIRKRHDWDADTIPVGDLSEPELIRLLIEFSLAGQLWVSQWQSDKGVSRDLREHAEFVSVEWKAIEAEVNRGFAERAAAKGRKGKALVEVMGELHGCSDEPAKKKKRGKKVEKTWPEPNEQGVFDPRDCEVIACDVKGVDAKVYLVQTEDGWRHGFDAQVAAAGAGCCPQATREPVDSRAVALAAACVCVSAWAQSVIDGGGSKKGQTQARKVKEWAEELRGRAHEG